MSFSKVHSAQTSLLKAHLVHVEVDLSLGLHSFSIVGLPDKAVEESKDRISAAIKNSGYKSPKNKKVVISLAPADLKKEGPIFDLAMAIGYLAAAEEIEFDASKKIFLGELSLDGELRRINGILPLVKKAKDEGFEEVYLPKENAEEAALIDGIEIYGAENLSQVIHRINKKESRNRGEDIALLVLQKKTKVTILDEANDTDFSYIKSQTTAKRGLEIAAAGGHNIAMYGPPGTGKTMLARAFSTILPPLSFEEMLEVTSIHSIAGQLKKPLMTHPPIRSPHHTSSYVALVGGGATPKPGEITLAHRGVLFLDEFPEFEKRVIETLRQPLEERVISISRARGSAHFPAHFILIAAMNPCPCGNNGVKGKECICSPVNISRYERKLSGPIIDRIDLWIEVAPVKHEELSEAHGNEERSSEIRKRVLRARKIQNERFKKSKLKIHTNSELGAKDIFTVIPLTEEVKKILNQSALVYDLSARGYHRVVKLARTIADLEESKEVESKHILEAFQYRPKRVRT